MSPEDQKIKNPTAGPHYLYSQRITALDLARVLAMLTMIQGHVIYALALPSIVDVNVFPWDVWHYLRGLTAPIFLTVSGAVNVFANKRDEFGRVPRKTTSRRLRMALILMAIGYTLMFPAERLWDIFFVDRNVWDTFLQVNILQLFGITLLMLLLLFLLTRSDKTLGISALVIGLTIALITPLVHSVDWFSFMPMAAASYLSPAKGTFFPIFPFSSYVFFGAALGAYLKTVDPNKRTQFILKFGPLIGIAAILAGWGFNTLTGQPTLKGYTLANSGLTLVRLGFVMGMLSLTSLIYLKTTKLSRYYSIFGKRALFIYVAHLVLLYGSAFHMGPAKIWDRSLELPLVLLIVVLIELLSLLSAYGYEYLVRKYPESKRFFLLLLASYLIYMLII